MHPQMVEPMAVPLQHLLSFRRSRSGGAGKWWGGRQRLPLSRRTLVGLAAVGFCNAGDAMGFGGWGDDAIDGGNGNDYLNGGDGDDTCTRGETTARCET